MLVAPGLDVGDAFGEHPDHERVIGEPVDLVDRVAVLVGREVPTLTSVRIRPRSRSQTDSDTDEAPSACRDSSAMTSSRSA